jgi:hypothetical protein
LILIALAVCLLPIHLAGSVLISEFMAANQGSLRDDFNETSDWIELFNHGQEPLDLQGWALTDRMAPDARWILPSRILGAGEYLVVFASGRNRKLPGAPLHTSFSLSAGGEYLALIRPDGTVASEFAPAFPRQVADVSFGFPGTSTVTILAPGAAGQAGVPTSLEDFEVNFAGWQTSPATFQGASWQNVETGVGYDTTGEGVPYGSWIGAGGNLQTRMRNQNESAFLRVPFVLDDPSTIVSLRLRMRWDDGFIAYLNGTQVAADQAPASPGWNSGATGDRIEALNEDWTDFDIATAAVPLFAGTNVLAIHGLNWRVGSSDFLILPALEALANQSALAPAYMLEPTPGAPNSSGGPLGPALSEATSSIPRPLGHAASPEQSVSVRVDRTESPIATASVRLAYRVMFGPETGVVMRDDGVYPDPLGGDGSYTAMLPTAMLQPGQMLRWRFEAADIHDTVGRAPPFRDPTDADYYFGTVAENADEATSLLPVLHQFIENPGAADTLAGTRAAVFYLGRFYDNIHMNLHGQSARGFPKKGHNLDFNADNRFVWGLEAPRRVKDVDLLSNHADKTRLRNSLAHEVARRAAAPYHFAFPVRVQRNATFHGVIDMVEDGDDRMLERNGLDPEGALYKMYNDMSSTNRAKKKTRKQEDYTDLQTFIDILDPALPLPTRKVTAYDHIDLAATINYLVTRQLNSDMDHGHKNYYLYRDTNRTREWQPILWDVDLSWGHDWTPALDYFDDHLAYDHQLDAHAGDNRLYYLMYAFPEMRAMFLRRMRTLMDRILEPPGTVNGNLEALMRAWIDLIDPDPAEPSPWTDGDRDFNLWGTWGRGLSPRPETEFVIANYLAPRRAFLFNQDPATRPRLPRDVGEPIPDWPQVNTFGMVTFEALDFLPASGNQADEYVILRNTTAEAVDISGWRLEGGITHTFTGGTVIPAGTGSPAAHYQGLLHVAKDAFAFRARTIEPTGGQRRFVQGNYRGQLSARGETVVLRDDAGGVIATVTYEGTPTPWQEWLRIAEIHYHPAPPSPLESALLPGVATGDFEYLEFVNIGVVTLDLAGVSFTQGITFTFPEIALAPGTRLVLAKNPAAFGVRYPAVAVPILGPYDGSLDNSGERIEFTDAVGENVLNFEYRDGWYPATDGAGYSLVVRNVAGTPYHAYDQPVTWAISLHVGGSPGAGDTAFAQAYYGWDNFHFTSTERDQPDIAGPYADADLDGHLNWAEYAFATHPRQPDQPTVRFVWAGEGANRRPGLEFRRAANALDLTFELLAADELTSDPASWTVVATLPEQLTTIDDSTELARYADLRPAVEPHRFLRIRAHYVP